MLDKATLLERYRSLTDDQLIELAGAPEDLVPVALEALGDECRRRGIDPESTLPDVDEVDRGDEHPGRMNARLFRIYVFGIFGLLLLNLAVARDMPTVVVENMDGSASEVSNRQYRESALSALLLGAPIVAAVAAATFAILPFRRWPYRWRFAHLWPIFVILLFGVYLLSSVVQLLGASV